MSELALQRIRENKEKHARGEDATELDLGNCGLTHVPKEIGELVWLKNLTLNNKNQLVENYNNIEEIPEQISNLTELEFFYCSGFIDKPYPISSFKSLFPLKKLTFLSVPGTKLSNLEGFGEMENLQYLDVSYTNVNDLSPLERVLQLTYIDISNNNIIDLTPLSRCRKLENLWAFEVKTHSFQALSSLENLKCLELSALPPDDFLVFKNLTSLRKLVLYLEGRPKDYRFNMLAIKSIYNEETLPEAWNPDGFRFLSYCKELEELELKWYTLNNIDFINPLHNLKSLNIGTNFIEDVTPVGSLSNLEELTFNQGISQVNGYSSFSDLKKLKKLSIESCHYRGGRHWGGVKIVLKLGDIFWIEGLKVEHLNLSGLEVSNIKTIENIKSLRHLSLCGLKINDISFLRGLVNLQHLDLGGNQINDLIPIKDAVDLEQLSINSNLIEDITPLGKLAKLSTLGISNNKITEISVVRNFKNLQFLYASKNPISNVEAISELFHLRAVVLDYTKISDLEPLIHVISKCKIMLTSQSFSSIEPGLEDLGVIDDCVSIYDAPLINPPPAVFKQGKEAILNYFQERNKKQFKNKEIKLILVGNSTAGKTSLVRYLRERIFEHAQPTTHGIQRWIWKPEQSDIHVNIWDFGGQEYYHTTHRIFLSHNAVYTLVWDKQTDSVKFGETELFFDNDPEPHVVQLEHFPHEWWIHNIRHYTKGSQFQVPILLVQNKCARDGIEANSQQLVHPPLHLNAEWLNNHIDLASLAEDAPSKRKRTWARRFEDFEEKILSLLEQQLEEFEFAMYHLDIRDEVRRLAQEGTEEMTYSEFETLCRQFEPDAKIDIALIYLRDITGDILHFPHRPGLKDRVFLRPDKICHSIYQILSRDVLEKHGLFGIDWVQKALQCDEVQAKDFIQLLRRFDLIFDDIDENDRPTGLYVAPQYLPDSCPSPDKLSGARDYGNLAHALTLRFLQLLPSSYMARFIARWGDQAHKRLFWKNGLLFKVMDCTVLVERYINNDTIKIDVDSNHPMKKKVLEIVLKSLQKLEDGESEIELSLDGSYFTSWEEIAGTQHTKAEWLKSIHISTGEQAYITASIFTELLGSTKPTLLSGIDTASVKELISEGYLKEAIDLLPDSDESYIFKFQLTGLNREYSLGQMESESFNVKKNQLAKSVLEFTGSIKR